jgi:hypothetical protein
MLSMPKNMKNVCFCHMQVRLIDGESLLKRNRPTEAGRLSVGRFGQRSLM